MKADHVKLQALYREKLGIETQLRFVSPQHLMNDRQHYQRFIIESKVQRAIRKFDENDPHIALAAVRKDGSLWLLDGQHHTEATVRCGATQVPVLVFESDGHEHEATIFAMFQEQQLAERESA
jgi:hypothetical protein